MAADDSWPPLRTIDDSAAKATGIRRIDGARFTLYTDVPPSAAVDELPKVLDLAVPLWQKYFDVSDKKLEAGKPEHWRVRGFLIRDKGRFERAGLLPKNLPEFLSGYALGREIFLNEQTSDYYRRHLMLHEGTHSFMHTVLGSIGPPWYAEGMAELLGTHRWADGQLALGYFPATREETPMLGRIKLVKKELAAGRALTLAEVMNFDRRAHLKNETYGWCWAAAAFLDGHPRHQKRFRELRSHVTESDSAFQRRFAELFKDDGRELSEEWAAFVGSLEYGHDLARMAIDFKPGKPLAAGGASVTIAAGRGWQNSGVRLEKGARVTLGASGRYQVADKPKVWWSEPGGVSIRYYQGRPLGALLATVRPDSNSKPETRNAFLSPTLIGSTATLTAESAGTLYFRINDSAGELSDNAGTLRVEIKAGQ